MVSNNGGTNQSNVTPVVVPDQAPVDPAKDPKKATAGRVMPKWEQEVRERLKKAIARYTKPMSDMVQRDANEGDTRLLVTDFLCEALGFDKYADMTTEYLVKGEFADYGLRIDKQLVAFVEVKRATTKLDVKHLRQVEMYAVNEGIEWVILTNGQQWKIYHLIGGLPMIIDLALEVSLLDATPPSKRIDQLFYLTKESLKRRDIDELWKAKRATSPKAFAQVLLSPVVLESVRRELKKQTGYRAEDEELVALLKATVLRPECFEK
ncbi:MAG: hypothetical protein QOH93_2050 [Chloroflexia bacterium]|nr:hypothetical protein [Chloroflexia bacterium]